MGLKFKQGGDVRTRADILLDAPENRRQKRKIMFGRAFQNIFSSVIIVGGVGFITYCSSLYMGSVVDIGDITGKTRLERTQKIKATVDEMPLIKKRTLIFPVFEYLAVDRIYLRRGQSILATYSLPKNSQLNLTFNQCKAVPVLEIFRCKTVSDQSETIGNKTTGFVEFTALRSGFYHFKNSVTKSPNSTLKPYLDYTVVWQRGGKQAH